MFKAKAILILIFLLSLFLRIYKLSEIPYGFHADEARAAFNSWTIFKTGMDDLGNKFPLYYDTFGDQRPTGIFYLEIPGLAILGRTVFASRLPVALFGALGSLILYYFVKLLTGREDYSLWSAFFLALSPWSIAPSRSAAEGVVAGTLTLTAITILISNFKKADYKKIILAVILSVISFMFYHSARVLVPVYWITMFFAYRPKNTKAYLMGLFLSISVALLLLLSGPGTSRFNQVSIFDRIGAQNILQNIYPQESSKDPLTARFYHNKILVYSENFINNYLSYFSPDFLLRNNSFPKRYSVPYTGLITYADALLFLLGLYFCISRKKFGIVLVFLSVSPLVSALTNIESPNLHRAFNMIYFVSVIEAFGAVYLLGRSKLLFFVAFLGYFYFVLSFWHNYSVHLGKSDITYHRDGGSIELAEKINSEKDKYEKLFLTDTPSDLTPWVGFTGDYDIKMFVSEAKKRNNADWSIGNLSFTHTRCPSALEEIDKNSLYIDAEGCPEPAAMKMKWFIPRPDSAKAYTAWSNKD